MKFVKNLFVLFLAFCMTAGICAAPSAAIAAGTQAADEDPAGEYTAFAAERLGMMTALENMGGSSSITLNEDGTGTFVFNGEESSITAWKFEDGKVTITVEGDEAAAEYKDGTLALDLSGDGTSLFHYAKEGVDTSGYDLKSLEEIQAGPDSKTNAAFKAIDTEAGAHLSYEVHLDSLNSDTLYDVHAKGGTYYSGRSSKAGSLEGTGATFAQDGKAYNLKPDKMEARYVTESDLIKDNGLQMDSLYQQLMNYSKDARYTEEKREYNGISYDAEVFAETKYSPGIAFSFGEDGQLAFVETSPFTTASGTELPVQLYTIHSIDGTIDESLLDISAYTIVEE
ncbi:MAG: hypothetical protein IJJ25_13425 [Lachnospiraceae bacterium]|nr:hypothetical protein [Lachnospiraceae bacterium]